MGCDFTRSNCKSGKSCKSGTGLKLKKLVYLNSK